MQNFAPASPGLEPAQGERGYRRRKLAAIAGNLYRTGQQAVTDLKDSYAQSRTRAMDGEGELQNPHIPGAFPDVAITSGGTEQMVLFPSYAKRHIRRDWSQVPPTEPTQPGAQQDEYFWRQEWEKNEDEKAIVDVDVRGWIYSPQTGPITRRNRILIGLARQLSGISVLKTDTTTLNPDMPSQIKPQSQIHDEMGEQERIEQEAARIEKKGQQEKHVASSGGYSEAMGDAIPRSGLSRRGSQTPDSVPGSPILGPRQQSNLNELTEAEMAIANANLMARIAPFMTTPLVAQPITVFFYNEKQSQSRTVLTNDAGHFNVRAALEFEPTHVRVLANESLSTGAEVNMITSQGVSLISDIDDTIKRSNISSGAREIFRNTFIRELGDLTIDGVQEWYSELQQLGVRFHYCSNSPWQLFPVLASFFKMNGLPAGSLHLKQYSGMLQGIFEPVAERKKGTLNRLLQDFPERKFLLVGDSGEADLEVYTDLALANPGRVLAIFIRDVTTPEKPGYFDSAYEVSRKKPSSFSLEDSRVHIEPPSRQNSAPITTPQMKPQPGPVMGTLIDFSEEPEEVNLDSSAALAQVKNSAKPISASDLLRGRKAPPPRPAKPAALRSGPSATGPLANLTLKTTNISNSEPASGPGSGNASSVASRAASELGDANTAKSSPDFPPPLPRRRIASLKNLSPRLFGHGRNNSDVDFDPLDIGSTAVPPAGMSYYRSGSRSGASTPTGSPILGAQGMNRKVDLWRRRVARAHELLEQQGVVLYTWKKGQDVSAEAVGIVKQALEDIKRR